MSGEGGGGPLYLARTADPGLRLITVSPFLRVISYIETKVSIRGVCITATHSHRDKATSLFTHPALRLLPWRMRLDAWRRAAGPRVEEGKILTYPCSNAATLVMEDEVISQTELKPAPQRTNMIGFCEVAGRSLPVRVPISSVAGRRVWRGGSGQRGRRAPPLPA